MSYMIIHDGKILCLCRENSRIPKEKSYLCRLKRFNIRSKMKKIIISAFSVLMAMVMAVPSNAQITGVELARKSQNPDKMLTHENEQVIRDVEAEADVIV